MSARGWGQAPGSLRVSAGSEPAGAARRDGYQRRLIGVQLVGQVMREAQRLTTRVRLGWRLKIKDEE